MAFDSIKRRLQKSKDKERAQKGSEAQSSDGESSLDAPSRHHDSASDAKSGSRSRRSTPASNTAELDNTTGETMRTIAVLEYGDIKNLRAIELPKPSTPTGSDVLVQVRGTSVNPIDTKVRAGTYDDYQEPDEPLAYYNHAPELPHIIGFDGAGVIEACGPDVHNFKPGDEVFWSGDPRRPGANAEYQLVAAGSLGRKPRSLDFVEAASMPLTWITAWEALVERLAIERDEKAGILIINGAGGVGSVASQIARHVLRLPVVVTTASRDETVAFSKEMGATHTVNHREDLAPQVEALQLEYPIKYVFITSRTEQYIQACAEICAPFGRVCSIVQTKELPMYGTQWMAKSLTFMWELMGTKPVYGVKMSSHGRILEYLRELVDDGVVECHLNHQLPATEEGIQRAHELQEGGQAIGKIGIGKDGSKDAHGFEDSIF